MASYARNHSLCIGIDFGTTFSGVAWAISSQPEDIRIVTKWRAQLAHNCDDAKAPTELAYDPDRNLLGWGYDITSKQDVLKWFKLCLVDHEDLDRDLQRSEQLKKARDMLESLGMEPVDAVAAYLREIWKHTVMSIEREVGSTAVKGLPFHVVITVPAIWKPNAMERTRQAVDKAGILERRACGKTTLVLVPEPEAAALAALTEFQGRPGVDAGDVFVICDAGGGTVDITSYKVESIDPIVVKESVEGDGKMCGAIFVDQQFEKYMRGSMPRKWEKMSNTQIKKIMNDDWEHGIKRGFTDEDRGWEVRLPAEVGGSILRSRKTQSTTLQKNHVRAIFDPVIGQIRALVSKQIREIQKKERKQPKSIMLVGGFGRCSYLHKVLQEEYSLTGIEVLQPSGNNPWTAICRGAVIKALTNDNRNGAKVSISSRVSRRSYGLVARVPFIIGTHKPEDQEWCVFEEMYKAGNQMQWYLEKGVDVTSQTPVRISWQKFYRNSNEMNGRQLTLMLFYSEANKAPIRKDNEVNELCRITFPLDVNFEDLFQRKTSSGLSYRELNYDVEMTYSGALLKFVVYVGGRRQGEQDVEISFATSGRSDGYVPALRKSRLLPDRSRRTAVELPT